jgi:ribosomal protein L34
MTKELYSGTGKRRLSRFSDKSLKRFKAEPFERMVTKEGNGVLTRRSAKRLTYQQYPITIVLSDVDLDSSLSSAR